MARCSTRSTAATTPNWPRIVLKAYPEPGRRVEAARHRALDRTPRLEQGVTGRHRSEANPDLGTEHQPASPAAEEQGPRDRQPREGALRHDPRPAEPSPRANRRADEKAASARRPAIPSPARPSSTSSVPSATRSTAKGRRSGLTSRRTGATISISCSPTSSTPAWSSARATRPRPSRPPTAAS